jgi:hypothetical protein
MKRGLYPVIALLSTTALAPAADSHGRPEGYREGGE